MFGLSFMELAIIAIVAVLLFGRDLPRQARMFGKRYKDFREGMADLQRQVNVTEFYDTTPSRPKASRRTYDDFEDREEISAPKFVPPPAEPQQAENSGPEAA
jgi:sec-independent protein translocase protein TatA